MFPVVHLVILFVLSMAASFAAVPAITVILNHHSHTLPGSPHYGIAPGAIFVIYGANLADTTTNMQNAPLPYTLAGVEVGFGAEGPQESLAALYSVSPTKIIGVMPSPWPVGASSFRVRNKGQQSSSAPVKVVQSAVGILSHGASGSGAAVAFGEGSIELGPDNSGKPGDVISIYGSGFGSALGDEPAANLTSVPITAEIGGMPAEVLYRGPTTVPGLDQLHVRVPDLAPGALVCDLPLVIKTRGISSNITTIPVALSGGVCPASAPNGNADTSITDADIERWSAAGSYTSGGIYLYRAIEPTGIITESYSAYFSQTTGSDIARSFANRAQPSTAAVAECRTETPPASGPIPALNISSAELAVGPFLHMSGPNGALVSWLGLDHYPQGYLGYFSDRYPVSNPGPSRYIFSGPGTDGIEPFAGSLDTGPEFVWTNREEARAIVRNSGLTIRWTGGDPRQLLRISGVRFGTGALLFSCEASVSAGELTVPANILNYQVGGIGINRIALYTTGNGSRIHANGIDYLTINHIWSTYESTTFK